MYSENNEVNEEELNSPESPEIKADNQSEGSFGSDSSDVESTTNQLEVADTLGQPTDTEYDPNAFDEVSKSGFFSFRVPVLETETVTLPNQKVGEEFSIHLEHITDYSQYAWEQLPDGIIFNEASGELHGVPEKDGQYRFRVACSNSKSSAKLMEYSMVVIPDPKTLWKNIPTDKNAQFWKTDYSSEIDTTQNIFAVAASNRGRSHAHEGKFREDDYALMCIGPSTWSVFAVADGGGSYKYSRRGSEIATNYAAKKLASLLEQHVSPLLDDYKKPKEFIHEDQEIVTGLYKSLIKVSFDAAVEIKEEAERFGESPKSFSTTLLLVAVKKFNIGHVVVGFNIGDGASGVLYNDNQDLYLLCVPESGEFAGQTRFLSTDEFKEENNQASRLRITVLDSFDAIAVMSDGVSDAKFPNDNSLEQPEFWKKLVFEDWKNSVLPDNSLVGDDFPEESNEIRKRANDWLDYWAPGTHDDRTLIVAFSRDKK